MNPVRFAAVTALAVLLGGVAGAQGAPNSVNINLSSYRFDPSPIVLQAGQPVRLVFQNRAGKSHDFSAKQFFKASRIISGEVKDGEVDVKGGEQAVVELVPARGVYQVHCSKFMHSGLGMKTSIIVQ